MIGMEGEAARRSPISCNQVQGAAASVAFLASWNLQVTGTKGPDRVRLPCRSHTDEDAAHFVLVKLAHAVLDDIEGRCLDPSDAKEQLKSRAARAFLPTTGATTRCSSSPRAVARDGS